MGGGTSLATVTSVCVVKRHGLIGLSRKDLIIIKRTLTEKNSLIMDRKLIIIKITFDSELEFKNTLAIKFTFRSLMS